ncbi:deleted in malignant brain tumors 1 protein-like isoform X2 [Xenopus laevis]|uniref:Deleted in malignant brain tumors 1 protein-like isoform X2 n=1 Tax=Xenopus laevis TaxID=8355 RepID=A0A8J0UZG4_XENLA|nr:deleted in malignant brain tumors 1 protein-like isoform X2 [Xenopus laevis]
MELALPISCYLLWFINFGVRSQSILHSSLGKFHNKSWVESKDTCSGVVLLFNNDNFSLACDDHWNVDSPLAQVVCLESGCGTPNATWNLPSSPNPDVEAIQGVQCSGDESSVSQCREPGQTVQMCAPEKIAAVTCNTPENQTLSLTGGRTSCDGHVEVLKDAMWRPLCYSGVLENNAPALCQQVGCVPRQPAFTALSKGRRKLPSVAFQCQENEIYFWECDSRLVNICMADMTTYLQCDQSRMQESWMVWLAIFMAFLMITFFFWNKICKTCKCCMDCYRHRHFSVSGMQRFGRKSTRRSIYRRESPVVTVQETHSPPSSPAVIGNPSEVNALLAPHGFRLNNTITPPPSYMHALKILSRPLENTQTPPPSYLEALKILSRPVIVHVHASENAEEKEDLTAPSDQAKEDTN